MQPGSSKDLRSSHTSKPGERLYKAFKLLEDKEKGAPANIKRYDGRVPGNPSYDVANVSDPRPKYDIFHRIKTTLDLPVPHFVIDDNYTGIPPKREVSVFDLNDNVNTTFLKTMASKVGDVVDIDVYYHPDRNKHLQMAMIFFREEADAFSFIRQQNGKSVMGIPIRCVSDPFFALLSQVYEQKVGQSCPVQNHLKSLSPHMLESKREKLRRNAKNEPSVSGYNSSFLDVDMDLQNSPEFEPAKPKQPRTPSPDEMTTIRPQFSFERSGTEPKSVERDSRTESSERPLEENTVTPKRARPWYPNRTKSWYPNRRRFCEYRPNRRNYYYNNQSFGERSKFRRYREFNKPYYGYRNHPTVPPPSYNSLPPTTIYNHFGQPPPSYYESDKYVKKRTPSPRSPERRRSRENKSKKKKKRSRQSSESRSSSTESSSLSDTEYLTVEKKEKSLKYTRAKEGGEIVEKKIKTVTYKRKEAKRGDSRASASGLQKISSDEDSGREQHKDKKKQDHRWSSSSSDSEEERKKRRHKATERVKKREAAHHLPGFGVGPSKNPPTPKTPSMPDIHHPPPPIVPASVGITSPMIPLFNPNQPPPMIPFHVPPPMIPPFTAPHGMFPPVAPASNVPSVGLRFVDSPPQEKPSLEDRLASLFGHKTEGPSTPAEATSIKEESYEDQVEDMDVEIDSDQSRSDDDAPPQIKEEPIDMALHMQNIVSNLCADIENELRKELCSVLAKDLQNKLQSHAFQHMEVVWQSKRAAMEEEKKNQAIAALKASQEVIKASPEKQNENKATNSAMLMTASFSIPKKITYQKKEIVDVKPKPFSGSISDHSAFSSDASDAEGSDGTKSSSESDGSTSGPIVKKLKNHSSAASSFSSSLESDSDSDKENVSSSEIPESAVASSDEAPSTLESSQVLLKDRKPEVVPEPQKVELIWPAATTNLKLLPPLSETITRDEYHVTLTEHCYYNINKVAPSRLTGYQLAQLQQRKLPQKPISKVVKKNELSTLLPSVSYREVKPPPVAKITFPDRTLEEKKKIIFTWEAALDSEDQKFVQEALAQLQPADGPLPPWKHIVPFAPVGFTPSPKLLKNRVTLGRIERYYDDEELDGILPHEFGCARARGYFKMSMKQKRSLIRRPEDVYQDKTDISERDEAAARHQVQQNKESRMLHRRLLTTMGDTNTDFFKVNQLKYRKKVIKFARSRIHGWGLYALEPIAPDDMIVEYVGQKIRSLVADEREKQYERRGIGSSYLFRIDENSVIDATKMGNFARFINHSCQPNCYAKVVTVDGDKRIVIYSKTLINKGDEITYDYKFPIEDDKIDCLCNAPNCRGTLN